MECNFRVDLGLRGVNRHGKNAAELNTNAATCFLELDSNGSLMVKHGSQRPEATTRKHRQRLACRHLVSTTVSAIYGPQLSNAVRRHLHYMPVHREHARMNA
ncbi:hypothetical protein HPP92_029061 [Vanilla planifolia]|uniref:Uncharacterized protein n=1 Tax=Vanilla planifolia TaxID=51239 RepID=A0A835P3N4_VANPL|nr:hypothetical protein HPP92_029050 [Vanilla planifolia]KAG0445993.1 hypothetical protein HPP92_029061 [Vanilla planifolia]